MSYASPAESALEVPRSELPRTSDSDAPPGDEPITWIINLSKPWQYVVLALFALYAPSAIGQGPLFEPYLQLLLFVSLVFGSLLISTTNLAGPLRYAYHSYKFLIKKANPLVSLATTKVTAWAPLPFLVLALLPWFRTWFFMGVIPVTWQFVRGEHQQTVSDVSNRVDEYCSKAEVAANKALSDAATAKQYEHDLEQNLRSTHFYDESSVGWIALNKLQSSDTRQQTVHDALATGARTVAAAADDVAAYVVNAFDAAQKSLGLSVEVQHLAARVKTAVGEGRMTDLKSLAKDVEDKLGAVEEESSKAATAKVKARSQARDAYLAWLSVREQHRKEVAEVTATVDKACIRVVSISALAQAELRVAEEHERIAHTLAANVTRDAHAAHHVRLTDFHGESAAAWAKLGDYMNAVKKAVENANILSGIVNDLEFKANQVSGKTESGKIRNVAEHCSEVLNHVLDLKHDGEKIREKVDRSERAAAKATKGREMHATAAANALTTLTGITTDVQAAAEAASFVTKHAGETRQHAIDAKAAIALGGTEGAKVAIGKLNQVLMNCEKGLETTVQKRKAVQAKMAQFSTPKYLDIVADPDPAGGDFTVAEEQGFEGGDDEE